MKTSPSQETSPIIQYLQYPLIEEFRPFNYRVVKAFGHTNNGQIMKTQVRYVDEVLDRPKAPTTLNVNNRQVRAVGFLVDLQDPFRKPVNGLQKAQCAFNRSPIEALPSIHPIAVSIRLLQRHERVQEVKADAGLENHPIEDLVEARYEKQIQVPGEIGIQFNEYKPFDHTRIAACELHRNVSAKTITNQCH